MVQLSWVSQLWQSFLQAWSSLMQGRKMLFSVARLACLSLTLRSSDGQEPQGAYRLDFGQDSQVDHSSS